MPDETHEPVTGNAPPPPEHVAIEMRGVYKAFGTKEVLRGINLQVDRGMSGVVLGGSGTGKSVLTKHIVGLLKPDRGEVWVLGDRIDLMTGDALDRKRLRLGYLFQGGALFDSMTVYENMRFFLDRLTNLSKAEKDDMVEESLEDVNLPNTKHQYPAELSGGQKKRIGLARTLILRPDIILYDEPTTGLDPVSVRVVVGAHRQAARHARHHLHRDHARPPGGGDHHRPGVLHPRGPDHRQRHALGGPGDAAPGPERVLPGDRGLRPRLSLWRDGLGGTRLWRRGLPLLTARRTASGARGHTIWPFPPSSPRLHAWG